MSSPALPRLLMPILSLLSALGIFSTTLYLPSLPFIGKALGTTQEAAQLTLTFFFLGSSIGSLCLGPIADRMGRLFVAKVGLLLFIIASFWCAESQSITSLQLGRLLQGIAASSGPLVARAIGRDLYEGQNLTRFSATIMMVISISPAIAPPLGGMIESSFGWQVNFYLLMLFGCILLILVFFGLSETNRYSSSSLESSTILKNYRLLFKNPNYGIFCFVMGIQMGALFCYITLSPYFYVFLFGWSPQEYGCVGILSAFGNILGFGIARHTSHRLHFNEGILIGSFFCLLFSLFLIGFSLFFHINAFVLIFYIICFYSASALVVVNSSAAAMNLFPHSSGTASAMVGAIQIGSGAFGSALASFLPISPLILGITLGGLSFLSLMAGVIIRQKNW